MARKTYWLNNSAQDNSKSSSNRGQWSKGPAFLLSCISMSVGLGNVWRFPYAAYANGGGAFLMLYLLLLCIIGRPLYYLELILGQFSGQGPIKVWNMAPALRGLGLAQVISTSYATIFYNYLIALTLYYMIASLQDPLPWTICNPDWMSGCSKSSTNITAPVTGKNASLSEQYWKYHVTRQSSGLDEITYISWELLACLAVTWTIVFLSISKGVKSLGKVSYFTAVFPYVILVALLAAALTTNGAIDGIKYFFEPKWEKLLDPVVWYRAVEQSFFSLVVCFGSIIMYASYNDFTNNVYRDAVIITVLDTFTSILAGCVIFAVLGSMAYQANVPIGEVVQGQGLGLAFIVYPEALSKFKFFPQLWSVLFFMMLFTLGIGSSVSQVETVLTAIKDQFTSLNDYKGRLALIACGIFCLMGIPLTTNAGMYILQLLDNYGVGTAAFLYGIVELMAVSWIYGVKNFCDDARFMLGRSVGTFWMVNWSVIAPASLFAIFIYGNYELVTAPRASVGIPMWGTVLGWVLAAFALLQIPFWICLTIRSQSGSFLTKIKSSFKPNVHWGPSNVEKRCEWLKWKGTKGHERTTEYNLNLGFANEGKIEA